MVATPVLVEVLRGPIVESRHRGSVIVVDADGATVLSLGDVEQPVFPRSAVKAIQALPLVESGAADAFGFDDADLALACASHKGEPAHTQRAASLLSRAGLGEADLECGSHWPGRFEASLALAREGETPSQLHNNCSGKHSAFLCTCRHLDIQTRGYVDIAHRSQQLVREAMQDVTGAAHGPENAAIDGCSIPTYAVPLKSLALGFARMATGQGMGPQRAAAARRLLSACMQNPFYTSGTGAADLRLMQAAPGRVFTKTGAEAVFCAAVPELGLGIALKVDDGADRASEALVAAVLARVLKDDADPARRYAALAAAPILSRKGIEVGRLRVAPGLSAG
jgi:L-asparaginase II